MKDNEQRAAEIVGLVRSEMITVKGARRVVAEELDAAEARGRAEMAAEVEALVMRHIGYGMSEVTVESLRGLVSRYLR